MNKEQLASRIKELIKQYKDKKDSLESVKKELEKLKSHRKVKKYIDQCETVMKLNKEMQAIIGEISAIEQRLKNE